MGFNNWQGMGRLTRSPEKKTFEGGSVTRFTIAIDRDYSGQNEAPKTDFIQCVAWGKTGEFIEKYFKQGSMILIIGRIETGSYEKNGSKVYTTEVNVSKAYFTGEKKQETPAPAPPAYDGFMNIPEGIEEDLPFS